MAENPLDSQSGFKLWIQNLLALQKNLVRGTSKTFF